MNKSTHLCIVFILITSASFLVSCKKDIEGRHPSLLIYPDSREIHFGVSGAMEQISYTTNAQYPAKSIIEWITNKLTEKGWHPLKESFLNPGVPSSIISGWGSFVDETTNPAKKVHQWNTDWSNSSGDILTYYLQYKYPERGNKKFNILYVYGIFTPKEMAEKALKNIQNME